MTAEALKKVDQDDTTFDIKKIREDFPILKRRVNGHPLVYLDNAATVQKPQVVIDAVSDFYQNSNSNVHRSVHTLGAEASEAYERARRSIAKFIGAAQNEEVIFTKGTTDSLNLVAQGLGDQIVSKGDDIFVTRMEHHSNFVPWQQLAKRCEANFKIIELTEDFRVDIAAFEKALEAGRPKLVCLSFMSNVLGVMNPIHRMAEIAKSKGATVVVDGAQAVAHVKLNLQAMRSVDLFAFSSHKMCGPTGVGVLWGRREILEKMNPISFGGDMILQVGDQETSWNELPFKFESGTPNIAGVIGLGAAAEYLQSIGMDALCLYEQELTKAALQKLKEIKGLRLLGPKEAFCRGPVFSFMVEDVHPHDLSQIMDASGVAVRAGHHCTQPLHRFLKIPASSRASFSFYNTLEEVDALVKAIRQAQGYFKK